MVDADRVVVNDDGTMKQVALSDFETYFEAGLDSLPNVTALGTIAAFTATTATVTMGLQAAELTASYGITAPYLTGTLATAAQPNITSLGTLSTLTVTAGSNPLYLNGLQTAILPNTASYLGIDTSTGRVVLTSSAQGSGEGGGIGAAEDCD